MEFTVEMYWYFHVKHGGILGLNREKHRASIASLLLAIHCKKQTNKQKPTPKQQQQK